MQSSPPIPLLPQAGEIHLWRIALMAGPCDGLSPDERDRAARFATDDLRRRWSRSRSGLRRVLSRYLGVAPQHVVFAAPDGKPALRPRPGDADLRFNLSHSRDLALCAVTVAAEVGVDVEQTDRLDAADDLAAQVLTPREHAHYARLGAADRGPMFFRAWTLKEALSKAIGIGLGLPFQSIDAGDGNAPLVIPWQGTDWHLCPLALPAGFAGAVALAVPISAIRPMDAP